MPSKICSKPNNVNKPWRLNEPKNDAHSIVWRSITKQCREVKNGKFKIQVTEMPISVEALLN
jgi:hypothetical protein